ncbi:MAG: TonB-dependent receptor, partial [Gemmatimonadetes bacterium]|nr:TonB-dependent receptor [Gemmatimonadota bacterium]
RDEVFWRTRFISPVITWHAGPATTLTVETEFKREEGLLDEGLFAPAPTLASLDEQPVNRFLGEPDVPADRARSAVLARLEQGIGGSWSTRIATSWSKNERNANRVDLRSLGGDGRTLGRRTDFRQQELETLFWDAGLIGALQLGPTSHRVAVGLDGYSTTRLEERFRGPVDPIDIFLPRYTGAVAPSPFAVEDQSVDMLGLYAQDQIALGDAFVLQLGLRYTTFDQLTVDRDDGTEEDFSDQELTTSAGVVHRVTPDVSIYGSMSEAFAPTLSVDRNGDAFDPNFGRQFELGLKADLLDRRLSTTIALYHLRRTGMISFVYPPEGGFYRVQSGVQRSRGFEVDLLGRLTGSVSAIASYGFTDGAVLEDDVYETGHGLGGAPRHHGSLWLRGGLGNGFYAGAGVFFQSEWKAFTSYPDDRMLRGYHRFEAMAGYSLANGVRLQLNGRNLANKRYYLSGGEGRAVGLPASPRSFELSVSWGTGALRR